MLVLVGLAEACSTETGATDPDGADAAMEAGANEAAVDGSSTDAGVLDVTDATSSNPGDADADADPPPAVALCARDMCDFDAAIHDAGTTCCSGTTCSFMRVDGGFSPSLPGSRCCVPYGGQCTSGLQCCALGGEGVDQCVFPSDGGLIGTCKVCGINCN